MIRSLRSDPIWHEVSMREYDVLYTLHKAEGPLRLGDLQLGVLLSQPALSRMVTRLESKGLLEKAEDGDDRRGVLVSLTSQGVKTQELVGRRHARRVAELIGSKLSDEEMATLGAICRKLAL